MRITRTRVGAFVLALALVVTIAPSAFAQALPVENHYKVYVSSPIGISHRVQLTDQFGVVNVDNMTFERFATPADKIVSDGTRYPMVNPSIHMDWWRISGAVQPQRTIIGTDQFGQAQWIVGDAHYLLLPSLKNVTPDPKTGYPPAPIWNHYLCYDAISGPLVGQAVTLVDQFGNVLVKVLQAKYFCNPVQKNEGGKITPIIDNTAHLACYQILSAAPAPISLTALDQFSPTPWQTQIYDNDCLCVPALKDFPVRTENSTWGKIKALYRN